MCLIINSIFCTAAHTIACELLLKASLSLKTVKIIDIDQIVKTLALWGSESVSGLHSLLKDWDLKHEWLSENSSDLEKILEIDCKERFCTLWVVFDLNCIISKCYSQNVSNRTQYREFFFTEEVDDALYLLAQHRRWG